MHIINYDLNKSYAADPKIGFPKKSSLHSFGLPGSFRQPES